jgi:hypothetical protein
MALRKRVRFSMALRKGVTEKGYKKDPPLLLSKKPHATPRKVESLFVFLSAKAIVVVAV